MPKKYRHILPVPNTHDAGTSVSDAPSEPAKRKRSATVMACNVCRAKKSACDGVRPACTACISRATVCTYISATPETSATIKRREIEILREDHSRLTEFITVLRSVPEQEMMDIVKKLRQTTVDPRSFLASSNEDPSEALPRQVMDRPPSQGSVEFELMIRHAIAYPSLAPFDDLRLGVPTLQPVAIHRTVAPQNSRNALAVTCLSTPSIDHQHSTGSRSQSQQDGTTASTVYCDSRLDRLDVSFWSGVNITSELAATLISLYLETDHPTLGVFDADLFLTDLIDCRVRYCSPLLVSAILSWACHAHSAFQPEAASVGERFFTEANSLWQLEKAYDSLPTLAAAQLLGLVTIYNGHNGGSPYLKLGIQMAQRMGLFGLPELDGTTSASQEDEPDHWVRAKSHTAWGVFNWAVMRSFMFQEQEPAVKYSPRASPPGNGLHLSVDTATGNTQEPPNLPCYMGRTFPAMCEFCLITREWATVYYVSDGTPAFTRVSFEFAQRIFQKLLTLSDNLNTSLARGDKATHHGIIFHIWFHASILQLFRPFTQEFPVPGLQPFQIERNKYAAAVFTASLNQLKHLAIWFRRAYACTSYAAFWHIGLLHIANGVMRDTKDPHWRAYFLLCVDCYADLYSAFRVAGGIIKSLLSIALRLKVITASDARNIMGRANEKGTHHSRVTTISASFIVDLSLADVDHESAQLMNLNSAFDDLALFGEFTEIEPEKTATDQLSHLEVCVD